jgi:CBS domain-containing protein
MNVYKSISLLLKYKISGAPVVDGEGKLVGVLSEKDCLRIMANASFHELPGGQVANYMSRECHTLKAEDDIFRAADIFLKHSFRRIPILNEQGLLVGQISRRDVLRAIQDLAHVEKDEEFPSKYLSPEMEASLKDRPGEGELIP